MGDKDNIPVWAGRMIDELVSRSYVRETKTVRTGWYKLLLGATHDTLFAVEKKGMGPATIHWVKLAEMAKESAPRKAVKKAAPVPVSKIVKEVPKREVGPFVYSGYTLHCRETTLAHSGKIQKIYFFSKHVPKSGAPCAMPEGYLVGVNAKTGLPYLKKGAGFVKAAPAPKPKAVKRKPDDLKLINGIGPEYEKRLNAAGVWTYDDLLKHKPLELEKMAAGDHFGNRPARERWKGQAKSLINKREKGKL